MSSAEWQKLKALLYTSCVIISLSTSRCLSQQGAKGSIYWRRFHLYILPPKNEAQTTINTARDITTRFSFSKISQYTYNSFVTFAKTPQRVLDNKPSAHVDKNSWGYHYPYFVCFSEFSLYNWYYWENQATLCFCLWQ